MQMNIGIRWKRKFFDSYVANHLTILSGNHDHFFSATPSPAAFLRIETIDRSCVSTHNSRDGIFILSNLCETFTKNGIPLVAWDGLGKRRVIECRAREVIEWESGRGTEYQSMSTECLNRRGHYLVRFMDDGLTYCTFLKPSRVPFDQSTILHR